MTTLIAQAGIVNTIGWWAIIAVAVIAIVAIVVIFAKKAGLAIPAEAITVLWVIAGAAFIILAIKLVLALV